MRLLITHLKTPKANLYVTKVPTKEPLKLSYNQHSESRPNVNQTHDSCQHGSVPCRYDTTIFWGLKFPNYTFLQLYSQTSFLHKWHGSDLSIKKRVNVLKFVTWEALFWHDIAFWQGGGSWSGMRTTLSESQFHTFCQSNTPCHCLGG
jgi:hypothetical protein